MFNSHVSHCLKLRLEDNDLASCTDFIKWLKISTSLSKQKYSFTNYSSINILYICKFENLVLVKRNVHGFAIINQTVLPKLSNLLSKNMLVSPSTVLNFNLLYKYSICEMKNKYDISLLR